MSLRLLAPSDESLLESFLTLHRDSSMFLRANARRAGLAYQRLPFQALYAGAFREGALVAVAAHCWNGMVLIQAPEQTEEVSNACVKWSGQRVTGLSGPLDQVRRARVALGLEHAAAAIEEDEELYALDLSELLVPAALATGAIVSRAPRAEERETLCNWRLAYDIETLGGEDSAEHRERAAAYLDAQIAEGNAWVAVDEGVPVSLSAFNASLPDIMQLGGIYTPPALRGRGYAKVAVGASLVAARERGASRAVLFTTNPSAIRCYQAVGFRRAGEYGLILLR